jgi:adenine-specific DNA-methyltransferase
MPTLEFKGKPFVYSHHLSVPFRELIIDETKSLQPKGETPGLDGNLIIHGDNLEALKALLPRYAGKVDVIYIDPPYNTGNEGWAYNDNVNAPQLKAWLGKVVDAEDMERHDKWLSMMWPRLQLLNELLSDNGTMFISINEIEYSKLVLMVEEVFSEDRHIGTFVWKSRQNKDNRNKSGLSEDHEYIIVIGDSVRGAARNAGRNVIDDGHPDGPWESGNMVGMASAEDRPNLHYDLIDPATGINYGCPVRGWRYAPDRMAKLIASDSIAWPPSASGRPREKVFVNSLAEHTNISTVILDLFTRQGTAEFEQIMDNRSFAFPKPSKLIERLIAQHSSRDALVLDSFAGSGTTAQAVLALNKADGGDRKFILIETEEYADKLTAERVRRVAAGVLDAKDETLKQGLGGSFTYCELGEPMDLERFFAGEGSAPAWEQVAEYVAFTATGKPLDKEKATPSADGLWCAGEAGGWLLHLIYQPDATWMRSDAAALTAELAQEISDAANGKASLVFSAQKFISQRELSALGITYAQLPYSIHRLMGDASDAAEDA